MQNSDCYAWKASIWREPYDQGSERLDEKKLSNVDLSTYCDGTDTQKEEWDEAYMQAVLSRIIIMNYSDSSICEKLDESIMNGQGQYPETISQAVALLTATSRANKVRKKRLKKSEGKATP